MRIGGKNLYETSYLYLGHMAPYLRYHFCLVTGAQG